MMKIEDYRQSQAFAVGMFCTALAFFILSVLGIPTLMTAAAITVIAFLYLCLIIWYGKKNFPTEFIKKSDDKKCSSD